MDIIVADKGKGKTTEAIKLANDNNAYLVVHNQKESMRIDDHYEMKFMPITYDEFIRSSRRMHPSCKFVIDNVEMFVQHLTHLPVIGITLTNKRKKQNETTYTYTLGV